MDQTFITIHNLSAEANILFASESISEVLGYQPCEVQNKSSFDYIHPDELTAARSIHGRCVLLDKAAVLHYVRFRSRDGRWITCECCFTVAHDVLVACTSIYRQGEKSQRRAIEAPLIRRLFSSSPRDPRYQMLEHLSPKFRTPPTEREPRAALILNRFTRALTVMFATNAMSDLLGIDADRIKGRSFYDCIKEDCLPEAVQCLESAKANDSMAYFRFWYRDPRREEDSEASDDDGDDYEDEDGMRSSDNDSLGRSQERCGNLSDSHHSLKQEEPDARMQSSLAFGSMASPASPSSTHRRRRTPDPPPSIELEAVVSCTSDGLVVILRRARPPIPTSQPRIIQALSYENDRLAAPWGQHPVQPYDHPRDIFSLPPPLYPPPAPALASQIPVPDDFKTTRGPPLDQLMRSIRDVAVFAWALVGINGNLSAYNRGAPQVEGQPAEGFRMSHPMTEYQGSRWPPCMGERWSQSAPTSPSTTLAINFGRSLRPQSQQRRQQGQPYQRQGWAVDELVQGGGSGNYTFAYMPPPVPATLSTHEYLDASRFQHHYHQPRHLPAGSSNLSTRGQQTGGTGTGPFNEEPTVSTQQDEHMTGV